jgi:hypothetical protein
MFPVASPCGVAGGVRPEATEWSIGTEADVVKASPMTPVPADIASALIGGDFASWHRSSFAFCVLVVVVTTR